jgi:hypothetical protein
MSLTGSLYAAGLIFSCWNTLVTDIPLSLLPWAMRAELDSGGAKSCIHRSEKGREGSTVREKREEGRVRGWGGRRTDVSLGNLVSLVRRVDWGGVCDERELVVEIVNEI